MVFLIKNFHIPVPELHRKAKISWKLFWLKQTHQVQQQPLYYSLLEQTDTRDHLIQAPASGLKTVYFSLHTCNSSTEDVNANLREARGKHCDPCLKCLKIHFLDCDLIKPPWQLLFLKRILSINTYKSMPLFQVSSRFCTVTTFHNLKKKLFVSFIIYQKFGLVFRKYWKILEHLTKSCRTQITLGLRTQRRTVRTSLTSLMINYASGSLAGPLCAPSW